jgi:dTDP-4-dehydrorhamnose reductase
MQRVLVLGGEGMLGQMVVRLLSQTKSLIVKYTSRNQQSWYFYDAENGMDTLQKILDQYGPFDYFINCIGILSNKINEQDSKSLRRAILINALFPYDLAILARNVRARVIHISTDGVFSGASDKPYLEDSPCDCVDIYGKTKSLGEVKQEGFLTLRCSIIGPDPVGKKGLLEWFLAQPDDGTVIGYTNHLWNGVTTLQFAELCQKIIVQERFDEIWNESPVHHFCPNRAVSKYELLEIFKSVFKKNVTIKPSCSEGLVVRRILATKYKSLKSLFAYDLDMEQAVRKLSEEI